MSLSLCRTVSQRNEERVRVGCRNSRYVYAACQWHPETEFSGTRYTLTAKPNLQSILFHQQLRLEPAQPSAIKSGGQPAASRSPC